MKKLILAAVAGIAIIGGIYYVMTTDGIKTTDQITLPSLSKSELTAVMKSKTASYKKEGFDVSEKDGVFVLTAKDEKKVRTFLFDQFTQMLPQSYTSTLAAVKEDFLANDKNIVSGLKLDMKPIKTDKGAKLEVTLTKLPAQLQAELDRTPKAKWFKDILEKGTFAYELSMDKSGTVNGIALKDIVEHIEVDNAIIDTKIEGVWAKFVGDIDGKFKMQEAVKMISVNVKEDDKSFDFTVNNIEGNVDQTTPFNQVASSSIERVTFNMQQFKKFTKFLMEGIAFSSKTQEDNGFIDSTIEVASHKTDLKLTQSGRAETGLSVDGFKFSLTGKHISKEAAIALQNLGTAQTPQEVKKLQDAVQKMLKTGLSLDVDALDVKKLVLATKLINLELKDFTFVLHAQLKENSLDMNMGSPMQYIPFIKLNARLAVDSADLDKIVAMQPMAGMFANMKKLEGTLAVFELAYVNGQITINGKLLPF